jgi:hypothetical protein
MRFSACWAEEGDDLVPDGTRGTSREEGEHGVERHRRQGHVLVSAEADATEEAHGEGGLVPHGVRELLLRHGFLLTWSVQADDCR